MASRWLAARTGRSATRWRSWNPQDRGSKFERYRGLDTLTEYVIVDAREVNVEHYTRIDGGAWRLTVGGAGDRVQLVGGSIGINGFYSGVAFGGSA